MMRRSVALPLRVLALPILALALACPSFADTNAAGDTQVTGRVGVGISSATIPPYAGLHVLDDATDTYAIRVSSADGTVFFVVLPSGNVGLGLSSPQTHLDLNGQGDADDLALQLRVGNSSNTVLSQQIVFASTAATYGHSIVTQHTAGQTAGNTFSFYLWNSTGQPNAPANLDALTLSAPTLSTGSVHIDPFGAPDVQLEVSNGACTGCGTIIRANEQTPSSRERKTDIAYLDPARQMQALEDVEALRHATYQYKRQVLVPGKPAKMILVPGKGKKKIRKVVEPAVPAHYVDRPVTPVVRGLIYEDTPESIRGSDKTIVLDKRVMNLELALQAADQEIVALGTKISELEKAKKRGKK